MKNFTRFVYFISLIFLTLNSFAQSTKSSATLRLESYDRNGCNITIPNNPEWNITYNSFDLKGDLEPNVKFTRRDPSSVLKVEGKYYVWYSYSLTGGADKIAPWDLNDLYYATSNDGITWEEKGAAIERGAAGSFDHRSAFTTEVFYDNGTFYLIYQAAADTSGIFGRNTIAMASASSPDGPWKKLNNPILSPTISSSPAFDSNAVHDPCLIAFKGKYYLYYKGEGDERNICGLGIWNLDKQVKWGVAIADKPTGPFVKSPLNPVTNTGHEVCVWNSGEGIGIMLHQDGPEFATLQYAEDGVNFDIKGKVSDFVRLDPFNTEYPEAAGLYRHVGEEKSPVSGVSWGLYHVLTRSQGALWMYLKRFENTDSSVIVDDTDNQGIQPSQLSTTNFDTENKPNIYPNPTVNKLHIETSNKGLFTLNIIDINGRIVLNKTHSANDEALNISGLSDGFYILKLTNKSSNNVYFQNLIKGAK